MRFSLPRRLVVAVVACAATPLWAQAGADGVQSAPPAVQAPATAPHGKVLFERHEALPDAAAEPQTETAPQAKPAAVPKKGTAAGGVSSSQGKTRGLRRRVPADSAAGGDAGESGAAPEEGGRASSLAASSLADDPAVEGGTILITDADREAAARVSAVERASVAVAGTVLDLHLDSHTGTAEARAQLTVRNAGSVPLRTVTLRVSGALRWESARVAGGAVLPLGQYHLADDLDHTGASTEIALVLPEALAPGASVALDLYYAGVLRADGQRLLSLGAPAERAARTDWDAVTDTFTGLRGVGDVLWYPVAETPAFLRDGDAVPAAVERARVGNAVAPFRLRLTLEYTGSRPEAAFFCGERRLLKPLVADADRATAGGDRGVVVAEWTRAALGPHTPSLFVATAAPQTVAGGLLRVVTERADAASALGEAAGLLRPMLTEWLGAAALRAVDLIDLPIPGATGFADGTLVVAPLVTVPAASLAPGLVGPLAAAWMPADVSAAWLGEGVPAFLQAVWAERTRGRTAALAALAATDARLRGAPVQDAAASSSSSSSSDAVVVAPRSGPPLTTCVDPACARGRAAYVLEMLRGMLGDAALAQALSGWRLDAEAHSGRDAAAETSAFEGLLQRVAGTRDLQWFFQSWVDADHGLPELSIVTVAPRKVERNVPVNYLPPKQAVGGPIGPEPVPKPGDPESVAPQSATPGNRVAPAVGSWLVAVEVQNAGGADAEVPVTVRAGGLTNTLRLRVPAHGRATVRVPFEADPEEVLVNDGSVPEVRTSVHRRSISAAGR